MRVTTAVAGLMLLAPSGVAAQSAPLVSLHEERAAVRTPAGGLHTASPTRIVDSQEVVDRYCVVCHNDRRLRGNMSLERFDASRPESEPEIAEKMVRKLRAGMMPPAGARRPSGDTLVALAAAFEERLDAQAAESPNPGARSFQRLNRAEYARSVHELLDLEIDAGDYLPLDTKSANFDNIADVQLLSPTLMDAYLRAASEVSRLAVGDAGASRKDATYKVVRWLSQRERAEGAPFGTRGGTSVVHTFPADGEYVIKVSFHHETTGTLFGNGSAALHTADGPELLEISVNGEPRQVLELGRWMHVSAPGGVSLESDPIFIEAGPQRISAAFVRRFEGPAQDLISPHEWSLASTAVAGSYGFTSLPHLRDMVISGPLASRGVSDTPSRLRIFSCRPGEPEEARPCARNILAHLAPRAYRRPLEPGELDGLLGFFDEGVENGGFEEGVRLALEAILASPHFIFRLEEVPSEPGPDGLYRLNDFDLAARLSYFLWSAPPDQELLEVAAEGRLAEPAVMEEQVGRMLADDRASTLATRFAAQWLRLPDLEKIHPDVRFYPDFHEQLKRSMRRETELFFESLVRENRSAFELLTADYTFLNERLARHYGVPGVAGEAFRRVRPENPDRRGLLGHASVLTLTSHADRSSPVLRGKWVMEVFLGSPPPPPPPNVPDLEATEAVEDGRILTVRERLEQHRANPACRSCHRMMDPIGLALENFDATGRWRSKDSGTPVDPSGELYDGTEMSSPTDLRDALLGYPDALLRSFTENLMAYALGRRVEYYDMPTVRGIVADAKDGGYRIADLILGIATSPAFQMSRADVAEPEGGEPAREPSRRPRP